MNAHLEKLLGAAKLPWIKMGNDEDRRLRELVHLHADPAQRGRPGAV